MPEDNSRGIVFLDAIEDEWQERLHVGEFPDAVGADEDDFHWVAALELVLDHYLTAGSAWGYRVWDEGSVLGCSDCDAVHWGAWTACAGIEKSSSFSADS